MADIDGWLAREAAAEIGGLAVVTDVGVEEDLTRLVDIATNELGRIDIFCSNAGVCLAGGVDVPDADWLGESR